MDFRIRGGEDYCSSKKVKKSQLHEYFDFSDLKVDTSLNSIDSISITITSILNLTEIHDLVREQLSFELTKVKFLEEEISSISSSNLQKSKMQELTNEMNSYKPNENWNKYKETALPILEKYIPLMPAEVRGIISDKVFSYEEEELRLDLILQYINLVDSVLNISIYRNFTNNKTSCYICNQKKCNCLEDSDYDSDEFVEEQDEDEENEDTKQTNTNPKPQIEWMYYFLGEIDSKDINKDLFDRMDEECVRLNFPISKKVKKTKEYNTERLIKLMKLTGVKNTKLRNLIGHKYWGWDLPVLTEENKEKFKRDCTLSRSIYPEVSNRVQNINLELTGYYLFGNQGFTFPDYLYKFTTNRKIINDANKVWRKTCDKLPGFTYVQK